MALRHLVSATLVTAIGFALLARPLMAQDAEGLDRLRPGQQVRLLNIDRQAKTIAIEILPATGSIAVSRQTFFVRGGKVAGWEEMAEQAEIVAVYSPGVAENPVAIVQLPREMPAVALRGVVRRIDGNTLVLRDSLLDSVDISEAAIVAGGQAIEPAGLAVGNAVIVVVAAPDAFDRQALLVMKATHNDTSLQSRKVRNAGVFRGLERGLVTVLPVESGRPEKVVLRYDDDTGFVQHIRFRGRDETVQIGIDGLSELLGRADGGRTVAVTIEHDPPGGGEAPLLRKITIDRADNAAGPAPAPPAPRLRLEP